MTSTALLAFILAHLIPIVSVAGYALLTAITALITHFSWLRRRGESDGFFAALFIGFFWFLVLPLIAFNFAIGGNWLCARKSKDEQ